MGGQGQEARRTRDAEHTRPEILAVATEEFARDGYSGARVDRIAGRTQTTERMIHYHFGSKESLYLDVLERAYSAIRQAAAARRGPAGPGGCTAVDRREHL
jgi:TetR/AcrR family transcriptional regulator